MSVEDLQKLPAEVKDVIFHPNLTNYNRQIADDFVLSRPQINFILDLEDKVFIKRVAVLDVPNRLEEMERAEYFDLRLLSLELATKIFWPLQDYLKNVDRLILRLGGKVPRLKHLEKKEEKIESINNIVSTVKQMTDKQSDFKSLRLTKNKIINKQGHKVSPTVANWLADYIHFLGAGQHSSLQRAQYLAKGSNVKRLDEDERNSIRYFLVSYDKDTKVRFDQPADILIVGKASDVQDGSEVRMEEVIKAIEKRLITLDKSLLSSSVILSEVGKDNAKLKDVLWQAVGLQDSAKVISSLRTMLEQKSLDRVIREDSRFKSIMKRFIGIRYGQSIENSWTSIVDKQIIRRVFFEMLFADKLNMAGDQSRLAAFYLTNLSEHDGQVVYLDRRDNKLKWRELQANRKQLVWTDNAQI